MSEHITPPSVRPLIGSVCLFVMAFALVESIHGAEYAPWLLALGSVGLLVLVAGWFRQAIVDEATNTLEQDEASDRMYKWSFGWFIFTELCLFLTFFAALFYIRWVVVPWLAGLGGHEKSLLTQRLLWPDFSGSWPLLEVPDPKRYTAPEVFMVAWGLPALNTAILLSSGLTVTLAHWALLGARMRAAIGWVLATVLLGWVFLIVQAFEYLEAYQHLGLKFSSGVYGNLFFLLTGFHGLHVFLGTVILLVVAVRMMIGSVTNKNGFVFEASSWYWHFVDVVWLLLFVFVYWV